MGGEEEWVGKENVGLQIRSLADRGTVLHAAGVRQNTAQTKLQPEPHTLTISLQEGDAADLLLSHLNLPQLLRVRRTCRALRVCVDGMAIWATLLQALTSFTPPSGLDWATDGIGRIIIEDGMQRGGKKRDPRRQESWPMHSDFAKCSKLVPYLLLEVAERSVRRRQPYQPLQPRLIISFFIPTQKFFPTKRLVPLVAHDQTSGEKDLCRLLVALRTYLFGAHHVLNSLQTSKEAPTSRDCSLTVFSDSVRMNLQVIIDPLEWHFLRLLLS